MYSWDKKDWRKAALHSICCIFAWHPVTTSLFNAVKTIDVETLNVEKKQSN